MFEFPEAKHRILIATTGSVASVKLPLIVEALLKYADVAIQVVATNASLAFYDKDKVKTRVWQDQDEWYQGYKVGDPILHIELRKWATILVIAPLDANTLAKIAPTTGSGQVDSLITCIWRAWDASKPILLAPAMNTFMWFHPTTRLHIKDLVNMNKVVQTQSHDAEMDDLFPLPLEPFNIRILPPMSKMLACGDIGVGAMMEWSSIVTTIADTLSLKPLA